MIRFLFFKRKVKDESTIWIEFFISKKLFKQNFVSDAKNDETTNRKSKFDLIMGNQPQNGEQIRQGELFPICCCSIS